MNIFIKTISLGLLAVIISQDVVISINSKEKPKLSIKNRILR